MRTSVGSLRSREDSTQNGPTRRRFFTFQGISYIVDLYRGHLDRARPLLDVMFNTLQDWTKDPLNGLKGIAQQAGFTAEQIIKL